MSDLEVAKFEIAKEALELSQRLSKLNTSKLNIKLLLMVSEELVAEMEMDAAAAQEMASQQDAGLPSVEMEESAKVTNDMALGGNIPDVCVGHSNMDGQGCIGHSDAGINHTSEYPQRAPKDVCVGHSGTEDVSVINKENACACGGENCKEQESPKSEVDNEINSMVSKIRNNLDS